MRLIVLESAILIGVLAIGAEAQKVSVRPLRLDPAYAFADSSELSYTLFLRVGPEKTAVLGDKSGATYVFGKDGGSLSILAKNGRGPGELVAPFSSGWLGDTLWVVDLAQRRVNLYPPRGGAPKTEVSEHFCGGFPLAILIDGTCVIGELPVSGPGSGDPEQTVLVRRRRGGAFVSQDYVFSIKNRGMQFISSVSNTTLNQPFGDNPLNDASSDGRMFVVGERRVATVAGRGIIELVVWRAGSVNTDTLRISYTPVPIPRDSVAEARQTIQDNAIKYLRIRIPIDSIEKKLFAPSYYPPFNDLKVGRDGRTWLRSSHGTLADVVGGQDTWVALDVKGAIVDAVSIPTGLRILDIDGVYAWTEGRDSFEVPILQRFLLTRK